VFNIPQLAGILACSRHKTACFNQNQGCQVGLF